MARRKNRPESVKVKCRLSERLHEIRVELYGERGGSEMARQLGLPVRTWYNYEAGVTVPAEVLLRFVELTCVEPLWLLHGRGPKFRVPPSLHADGTTGSVRDLLRTALLHLEQRDAPAPAAPPGPESHAANGRSTHSKDVVLIRIEGSDRERLTDQSGPPYVAARREWLAACRDCRCVRVEGDAMFPIIADGAYVAFSDEEERVSDLAANLVVAWVEGQPRVRWFDLSGRFGLLRAENPAHEPNTTLLDLDGPPQERRIRRVLWISTPH